MVVTGVDAVVPERLKCVVYLDAYVPEDGRSAIDLWPPERRAFAQQAESDGLAQPPPPAPFGVSDLALVAWIEARIAPHPSGTYADDSRAGRGQERSESW